MQVLFGILRIIPFYVMPWKSLMYQYKKCILLITSVHCKPDINMSKYEQPRAIAPTWQKWGMELWPNHFLIQVYHGGSRD